MLKYAFVAVLVAALILAALLIRVAGVHGNPRGVLPAKAKVIAAPRR